MGIFDAILGSNKKEAENKTFLQWIPLTSIEQLKKIKEQSITETIFIFKHSTRCSISSMVKKQFEKLFAEEHKNIKVYYLDLLNYRNVSDQIPVIFKVEHQSPQLLVIKNQVAVYNASHYNIAQINLNTLR